MSSLQFSEWHPLTQAGVNEHAPTGAAAVQIRCAEGLVDYPSGRSSAMVCYFYASDDARHSIEDLFADELEQPGVRGQGRLWFRFIEGGERVLDHLKKLLHKFYTHFGAMPLFNQKSAE